MWRKKKVILISLLVAVALTAVIGGVALADDSTTTSSNTTQSKTLLARVAEILGIDQQKVEDAFNQAKDEMQLEAVKNRLQALVEKGTITQEQADRYLEWWQAKPDMAPYQQQLREWMRSKPGVPEEFKQWQEGRPDVPLPGGGAFKRGGFRGMGGLGGIRCPVVPQGLSTN